MAMNIMEEKFYSIGEFARLSGTTRDSLIHYDNIGLLKPARVGENGYRYYVLMQVYQVKWIQYMQRLGLRLHDIQKTMGGGVAQKEIISSNYWNRPVKILKRKFFDIKCYFVLVGIRYVRSNEIRRCYLIFHSFNKWKRNILLFPRLSLKLFRIHCSWDIFRSN